MQTYDAPPPSGSDDTASLLGAIMAAPDTRVVLAPDATYIVDGALRGRWPVNVELDLNGATLKRTTVDQGSIVWPEHASHPVIHSGVIEGPNPEPVYPKTAETETENGVRFGGCSDAVLRDVTIRNVFGDFVYVGNARSPDGSGGHVPNRDVLIQRVTGSVSGRQGISPTHVIGCLIVGCDLRDIPRSLIDCEPQTQWEVRRLSIVNVEGRGYGNATFANGGDGQCSDVLLDDVRSYGKWLFVGGGMTGSPLRERYTVHGCWSDTELNAPRAAWFRNVRDVWVGGNTQPGRSNRDFVQLEGCDRIRIIGNAIPGMRAAYIQTGSTDILERDNLR